MTLRVKLTDLDRKTIEGDAFVSPFVQHCVLEKLRSFDAPGRNAHPKTVFKDDANLPVYPARDGQPAHVIRRVKVYRSASNAFIARKSNAKGLYKPGGNHHVPILVEVDDNGNEKRDQQGRLMLKFGDVVSRFDAMRRWASSEDVVRGPYLSSVRVEFTLMVGDVVEMSEGGQRILYRLLNMSNGDFQYRSVHLAEGTKSSLNDRKDLFLRITSERDFSIRSPRKVIVDPLGRVYRSGG